MPKYKYKAKNMDSKIVHDIADAADVATLRKTLRTQGLFLVDCKSAEKTVKPYKLKAMELSDFSRQLSSMLEAGITVIRALGIMKDRNIKPQVKGVYERLYREVQQGVTLSAAMEKAEGCFPSLIINMFKAGESSGQMAETALKMAVYYEKEYRTNTKVKNAMIYPIILVFITIAVVIVVFTWILPQFFDLFQDIELPAITQAMLGISNFLTTRWYVMVIICVLIFAGIRAALKNPKVREKWDQTKLHIPKVAPLLAIIYTARFARTLSSLYSSGLSMINALQISSTIIGNTYIENQFAQATTMVRSGDALSKAIGIVKGFDNKLISTIFIGEETGSLDSMLESTADSYDYESEMAIQRLVTIIEPVMIVLMALIIGTIMLSVMMPLMQVYQSIG